jgi:hypothetical protein
MRVFRPVVEPTTGLLARSVADRSQRWQVGAKLVGDDCLRLAVSFIALRRNFNALAIADLCRIGFGDFASWSTARQIVSLAVHADETLIQMPAPL